MLVKIFSEVANIHEIMHSLESINNMNGVVERVILEVAILQIFGKVNESFQLNVKPIIKFI